MSDKSYVVEFKLLDVLKALAFVSGNTQDEFEWLNGEIKELEKLLLGDDEE